MRMVRSRQERDRLIEELGSRVYDGLYFENAPKSREQRVKNIIWRAGNTHAVRIARREQGQRIVAKLKKLQGEE